MNSLNMNVASKIAGWLNINQQIGLDLGSSFIRLAVPAKQRHFSQPSVVAKNIRSDRIVAIGDDAQKILGRTPAHIETIHPIVEGVIDNSAALEALLSMLLYKYSFGLSQFTGQDILVALPAAITDVDTRIVATTLQKAGARRVLAVPASVAALVGVGAPVGDPTTQMVVNIGAGVTQVAAISGGSVVAEASSTISGGQFDAVIAQYITDDFGVKISGQQARKIKHELGAVRGWSDEPGETLAISGQDEASNLPREITLSRVDVTEAIEPLIDDFIDFIEEFVGSLSSDMVADISSHGLHLIGGGSRLDGLNDHVAEVLDIAIHGRVNPEQAVIEGLGYIIDRDDGQKFTQPINSYESTE